MEMILYEIIVLDEIYIFLLFSFLFEVVKMFTKIKQNFSNILIVYQRLLS
jgi:hypothetical protein